LHVTLRPVRVSEILQNVRQNLAILSADTGCSVEYHVPTELPLVMGDLLGLTQCLQNVIANAIKYSGQNSRVQVSVSVHAAKQGAKEVQISVRDNGSGIDRSDLRHIFEPFYRSPKVVQAQIHGTGLGLTVAARVAEAMRGTLSVTSEVGVGSEFILHLHAVAGLEVAANSADEVNVGAQR